MDREQLLDRVLDQITLDVNENEFAAIHEMIAHLSDDVLNAYLAEEI